MEEIEEYGDKDVNAIVELFNELYGVTKRSQWDRFAAHRMAISKQYGGVDGVMATIRLYHQFRAEKYAPGVSSVRQFEEKLPAIVTFLQRKMQDSEVVQL